MLMLPITTAVQTSNIKINNSKDLQPPQIYITQPDLTDIKNFIEKNFEDENEKNQAYTLLNNIIDSDLEVDILKLAEAMRKYYVYPEIPEDELNDTLVAPDPSAKLNQLLDEYWNVKNGVLIRDTLGNLINKIIEIIQGRLGWTHHFFNESIILFVKGVRLLVDFIAPAFIFIAVSLVKIANKILAIPGYLVTLLEDIFELEFSEFIDQFLEKIDEIAGDIDYLIYQIIDYIQNPDLNQYLTRLQDFMQWIEEKPWQKPILVSGVVRLNGILLTNANVTCRGVTTKTDNTGQFRFNVPISPSDDSLPPNKYYGMHNCSITVEKDGKILKQTIGFLSYVFSNGTISWPFFIIKNKTRERNFKLTFLERFHQLLERIKMFFPDFFIKIRSISFLVL